MRGRCRPWLGRALIRRGRRWSCSTDVLGEPGNLPGRIDYPGAYWVWLSGGGHDRCSPIHPSSLVSSKAGSPESSTEAYSLASMRCRPSTYRLETFRVIG